MEIWLVGEILFGLYYHHRCNALQAPSKMVLSHCPALPNTANGRGVVYVCVSVIFRMRRSVIICKRLLQPSHLPIGSNICAFGFKRRTWIPFASIMWLIFMLTIGSVNR